MADEGLTHAISVIAVVRFNSGAWAIVTSALLPLNTNALPNLPDVVQVALAIDPVLPLLEASAVVGPVPSPNPYTATSPDGGNVIVGNGQYRSAGAAEGGSSGRIGQS